jgi:polar amino acid transport system permease protein
MTRSRRKSLTILDILILTAVLSGVAFVIYRFSHNLNYKWNWSIIPTYMVKFDQQTGRWQMNVLLQGLMTTIKLSIWAMILAGLIGTWMGFMRTSTRLFNRMIGSSYVELIRNLPPLVLVFIFYFFVSDQIMPLLGIGNIAINSSQTTQDILSIFFSKPALLTQFLSGVFTIALFQGAYITEIVRGGIQSIDNGQWEAASALGLTRWKQMRLVILPQAIRIMLPPLANEFINTIKYSSIVSVISIQELTFQGFQVMATTQVTMEVWLTITAMYLILCLFLSLLVNLLEKKLACQTAV